MSGLSAYIFRQVLGPLIFFTFALVGVAWLSQSLRMLDLVINQSQSALTYLYLTVLALPQVLGLLLPFALVIAVIYALNRLYVENELVVIWAAGFNRWAVIWPVLSVALLATIAAYVTNLMIMPAGMRVHKSCWRTDRVRFGKQLEWRHSGHSGARRAQPKRNCNLHGGTRAARQYAHGAATDHVKRKHPVA